MLLIVSEFGLAAEKSDTIVSKSSLFIFPHASYQQETSVAPGVAYGYYFKSKNIGRISSISGSAVYTFRHQILFNLTPKIYFNTDKWYLYANFNLKNYPDYYFGFGNIPTNINQAFTSRNISLLLQPQFIIAKNFFIGTSISVRYERIFTDSTFNINKADIYKRFGNAGWTPYSQFRTGVVAAFDNRDNQFYPTRGVFVKSLFTTSKEGWGSSYSMQEVSVDYRQYLPVFVSHTLAWQLYYDGIFCGNNIPFQLLPTVGGRDIMRGFRQGMYRENVMMMFQTEYRMPIYKRLKSAVFFAVGDVMNSSDYRINKLKAAYGAGFRYRLNDARVHLRLDFAQNNYGDKLQFYITATEAF